jgi:hypothetical protein
LSSCSLVPRVGLRYSSRAGECRSNLVSVVSLRGGKAEAVASVERPGLEDFNPLGMVEDRAPGSEVEKL